MSWLPEIMDKPYEMDLRRGIHVKLLPDTRNAFRVLCLQRGLSMQEVFEELAQRMIMDDPYMLKLLDDLVESKREKVYRQLSQTDAASLYDMIERESVLKEK